MPIRQRIVELRQSGQSLKSIAQEKELSYSTVKNICRRFQEQGLDGLVPGYSACGSRGVRSGALFYRASLWLKRKHPQWGAPIIHLKLSQRYGAEKLPSIRQLQRWFRLTGLNVPRPRQEQVALAESSEQVHQIWQIDAKEQLVLSDGQRCNYLSVVDQCSGAALGAVLFPKPSALTEEPLLAPPNLPPCRLLLYG